MTGGPPHGADDSDVERSLDRQLLLGLVLGALLLAGFPLYALREPARLARAAEEQRETYVRLGKEQFALHCASCHGDEGGGGGIAPTLRSRELLGQATDAQLTWLIAGGVPGTTMSAYHLDLGGPFTDQHVAQLVTYLRSLEAEAVPVPGWREGRRAPPRPVITAAATTPAPSAAEIYARTCAACHGARGETSPTVGPRLFGARYLASRSDSVIAELIAVGKPGTAMMGFGPSGNRMLTAPQIDALVRWIRSPRP